jgi:hypothetical protein
MPKHEDDADLDDINTEEFEDDEPLPVKRDTRIFQHKKDDPKKDEDFEEDVFV